MKIVIFTSCSQRKSSSHPRRPKCNELTSKDKKEIFLQLMTENKTVKDMFRGSLNISITQAIRLLRLNFEVKYYVVSAGFGIVEENEMIPPYDCSFLQMSAEDIKTRAEILQIPQDFQTIIDTEKPDLIYLALNSYYQLSLGNWDDNLPCKTIAYFNSNNQNVITFPEDHITYQEGSSLGGLPIHASSGFKDDLLLLTTRYLKESSNPIDALKELLDNPEDLIYTINTIRKNLQ
ncbi:MAG: hypothetical protein FK733_16150 [Asgard group archaeon]|nr:hypothetical protein [Asgard group archaeon]